MLRTRTAHDGLSLPLVGFGTYALNGATGVEAIVRAIDNGYTLLDSAFNYENEGALGRAVRTAGRPRGELIVTSKLPGRHHARDKALRTVEESLYRTGLDYLDLYLIHWPNPLVDRYVEAWEALIEARNQGLVRHVGVCNFLPEHLLRLHEATGEFPAVNQVELHPYFAQHDQVAFDAEHGIITEAWSPLFHGSELLDEPVLGTIAHAHGATPGQVALAWSIACGAVPLPKAASPQRQLDNLAAAELNLSQDEVAAITALGRPDGRIQNQDPAVYQEF